MSPKAPSGPGDAGSGDPGLHGGRPGQGTRAYRVMSLAGRCVVGPVPSPGGLGYESARSADTGCSEIVPYPGGLRATSRSSATRPSHQLVRLNSLKAAASWAGDIVLRRAAISALARTSRRSLSGCRRGL